MSTASIAACKEFSRNRAGRRRAATPSHRGIWTVRVYTRRALLCDCESIIVLWAARTLAALDSATTHIAVRARESVLSMALKVNLEDLNYGLGAGDDDQQEQKPF